MSDLTEIQYPCYIHKKIEGPRLSYVHDSFYYTETKSSIVPTDDVFNEIYKLRNYVLEMIQDKHTGKIYIYDGMTIDEYNMQNCELIYEDRLGLVRHCVNCIGKYKIIIDMPLDICNDVGDVLKIQDKLKKQGYSSIVKNMHDKYNF